MQKSFKKIKYLVEYSVFIAVLNLLKLFGLDKSAAICSMIARKIGPFLSVTKIAKKNLATVFNCNTDHQKLIDQLWDNYGRFIGEFPYVNSISEDEIAERIQLVGLEHLTEFQKSNQPFLLFTGHFANWDFALRIIGKLYHKFGIVYRKANNPYVDKIIKNSRKNNNVQLIVKGPQGGRDLIKAIKSGCSIAMLVDQKMNDGVQVPFFGRPAMTANAIAKFAMQFDYPIIPCQIIRTKGSYFKIVVHPPLQFEITGNLEKDSFDIMLKINQILEEWIREHPDQWFWFHNRWK